jgi:hypothetical protein
MLVAYFTTDEVHEELALRLAAETGTTLCPEPFQVQGELANGDFDAVVYDWDYLPTSVQQTLFDVLLARPLHHPVAIHSYHMSEDDFETLKERGVHVHRRLEASVFQELLFHELLMSNRYHRHRKAATA